MSKKEIKIDNVAITADFIAGHASEGAFIEAMSGKGYEHLFAGDNREQKIKALYAQAKPAPVDGAAANIAGGGDAGASKDTKKK